VPGDLPQDADNLPSWQFGSRLGELGRQRYSQLFALAMSAGARPLPRVLNAWPTTSRSIVHSGTGRVVRVAHVCGSRGVTSEKTWSNVRAAASRWVNA
jgi:hypothetical protein